jgi:phage terminase large subunit
LPAKQRLLQRLQTMYQPRGSARQLMDTTRPEVLIGGPAGTGKSRACLEKLNKLAWQYPRSRYLVVRKTRESMTESVLVTMEDYVLKADDRGGQVIAAGGQRNQRHSYRYPNGSEIIVGGLRSSGKDTTEKVMSTEYDVIYVPEAIELTLNEWERLSTRKRNGRVPYQQMIADCNPSGPNHWLWLRCQDGKTAYIASDHRDNPRLWDAEAGSWTPFGVSYMADLDALTGTLRERLRLGRWVQAEGVVYDNFDLANLCDDDPDPEGTFEIAFDDGYVDPRAILFIQRTGTRILVFDEMYHRRHLEEVCVSEVLGLSGKWFGWKDEAANIPNKLPEIAVGSHEATQLHKRFRQSDIPSRTALHKIVEGIKVVRGLVADGNGYRTLQVNRRCKNLINELTSGYQYPPEGSRRNEEEPLDENNHACDALRMWAWLRARA